MSVPESDSAEATEFAAFVRSRIAGLRPRLLDLTRRNPLISTRLQGGRGASYIRVVDEQPEQLFYNLTNGEEFVLDPLPGLEDELADEKETDFTDAHTIAQKTDEQYLEAIEEIDPSDENSEEKVNAAERALKDRVRELLGWAPRQTRQDLTLAAHAKNHGISPSYDLPEPNEAATDGRHDDDRIQTLLLPDQLERLINRLISKCNSWKQETGLGVLRSAFGYLEWTEPGPTGTKCLSPLILMECDLSKTRGLQGPVYKVKSDGDKAEINSVLAEKLKNDCKIDLPDFDGSVESYLEAVEAINPKGMEWRIRRFVAIGVFPSSRMAMYHDIDPDRPGFETNEIVEQLLGSAGEGTLENPFAEDYDVDTPSVEADVPYLVLDADSSQFSTLVDVVRGEDVALEGPPGSGKSQTIVNAIALAMASGKKVLFVAEKMAALDVVRSRMELVGLGEFVLPLQASRASKEQVIQSIRNRIEIQEAYSPQKYEATIEKYKDAREQIAQYLECLGLPFGESGKTVHDVIGRAILTDELAQDLPSQSLQCNLKFVEYIDDVALESLLNDVEIYSKASEVCETQGPAWKDTGLDGVDRLIVEDLVALAGEIVTAIDAEIESQSKFEQFGLTRMEALRASCDLRDFTQNLLAHKGASTMWVERFLDGAVRTAAKEFLAHMETVASEEQRLSNELPGYEADDCLAKLELLARLLSIVPVNSLTELPIREAKERREEEVKRTERLITDIEVFFAAAPELKAQELNALSDAADIIQKPSAVAKDCLGPRFEDRETIPMIESYIAKIEAALKEKSDLVTTLNLDQLPSANRLAEMGSIFQKAGVFRSFSGAFKAAKAEYLRIAISPTFDKSRAANDCERAASYLKRASDLAEDTEARRVFGIRFAGVETPIELYKEILCYCREVDEAFSDLRLRPLRKFLKTAERDVLDGIPNLDLAEEGDTLEDVKSRFGFQVEELAALDELLDLVSSNRRFLSLNVKYTEEKLRELSDRLKRLEVARQALDGHSSVPVLGDRYQGHETNLDELRRDLEAADAIIDAPCETEVVLSWLRNNQVDELILAIDEVEKSSKAVEAITRSFVERANMPVNWVSTFNSLEKKRSAFLDCQSDLSGIYSFTHRNKARAALEQQGVWQVVASFEEAGVTFDKYRSGVDALLARSAAGLVFERHGKVLRQFDGAHLDDLRRRLADYDREIVKMSRQKVRSQIVANANPPSGMGRGKKSTWTEMSLLRHQITLQKKFQPPRQLTVRAGRALQEIKPCWMMSPLAVAQFIPSDTVHFDIVIIDEASQMAPENAIGALLRADQVMVVGDTNQLPPSNFFKKLIDDIEQDEDEAVTEESILEIANSVFRPARRLRWHYRSRHSSLIAFSNRQVYDDDLIVFPSASEDRADMGVSLVETNGLYKSSVNILEADAVVKAAVRFMINDKDRSLGIVTLNKTQADIIEERLGHAIQNNRAAQRYVDSWATRDDGIEQLFVKNLENVQGDERDVIFISTVYGPEQEGGRVNQRFGPINGVAGKRRLNVLFTRAKEQIITFTSMTGADILATAAQNAGVHMLKRWLEYSKTGVLDHGEQNARGADSPFEEFVAQQIRATGCEVVHQVGVAGYFIDLGIKHPDWPHGYILGVECDGASYHSSRSARDRDRLRQEVLERLGWHFHRVWSTDWFNDPRREAEKIRKAIKNRLKVLKTSKAVGAYSARPVIAVAGMADERLEDDQVDQLITREKHLDSHQQAQTAETKRRRPAPNSHLARLQRRINSNAKGVEEEAVTPQTSAERRKALLAKTVEVGDLVTLDFLEGARSQKTVVLSDEPTSDPVRDGIDVTYYEDPLGDALFLAELGDEISFLQFGEKQKARIVKIVKELSEESLRLQQDADNSATENAYEKNEAEIPTEAAKGEGQFASTAESGDRIRLRYLTGEEKTIEIILSDMEDNPAQGIVHIEKPLGKAVFGMEIDDEIEVLIGSHIRKAVIEGIEKGVR